MAASVVIVVATASPSMARCESVGRSAHRVTHNDTRNCTDRHAPMQIAQSRRKRNFTFSHWTQLKVVRTVTGANDEPLRSNSSRKFENKQSCLHGTIDANRRAVPSEWHPNTISRRLVLVLQPAFARVPEGAAKIGSARRDTDRELPREAGLRNVLRTLGD